MEDDAFWGCGLDELEALSGQPEQLPEETGRVVPTVGEPVRDDEVCV